MRSVSTSLDRCPEDVRVVPVIVAELELGNIEGHVFAADLVERADNAALKDRPEALNRIRVDCADDILLGLVFDCPARIFRQAVIEAVFSPR